ncbi:MAG: helix-turn-helix domain-containing protein [Bacteroidota bacterium]
MGKLVASINTIVGNNIRTLRVSQNISQNQLAYESGLTREFINKVESGKCNISIKKLAAICEALNIPPKKLFESIK